MSVLARAALVASLLTLAAPAVSAAPPDPFLGGWGSVDIVDDSNQRLAFGGHGATRSATLFDDLGTVCGLENESPARARGVGAISGDSITVEYDGVCVRTGATWTAIVTYEYDAGANTLTDGDGTIWAR